MAWTTIADWADGDILSATKLNQVVDNLEYLWALTQSVNPPREMYTLNAGDGGGAGVSFKIVHKHRYLYFRLPIGQGTVDDIGISYDSTDVFTDGDDHSAGYVYEQTIDLDPFGFTVGQAYTLSIGIGGEPGSSTNRVDVFRIYEHP